MGCAVVVGLTAQSFGAKAEIDRAFFYNIFALDFWDPDFCPTPKPWFQCPIYHHVPATFFPFRRIKNEKCF
jgi:hypothetical protein